MTEVDTVQAEIATKKQPDAAVNLNLNIHLDYNLDRLYQQAISVRWIILRRDQNLNLKLQLTDRVKTIFDHCVVTYKSKFD